MSLSGKDSPGYGGAMKLIRIDDIAPAPWKNGGGLTREIALCADDGGMIWRLSFADVERAGPFSRFPGLTRVLTVIEGAGLDLRHEGGVIEARPGVPVRFGGEIAIQCDLVRGPVRDFNLIFDPRRAHLDVVRLEAGAHEAQGLGLLPLSGACEVEGFGAVAPGFFLLFESDAPQRVTVSGAALAVTRG